MTSWFDVLYVYIAIMAWVFVALYATRPFYRSAAGWNYMLFTVAMAVMFTTLTIGDREGAYWLWVWAIGLTIVALVITHRVALLIHDIWADLRERH